MFYIFTNNLRYVIFTRTAKQTRTPAKYAPSAQLVTDASGTTRAYMPTGDEVPSLWEMPNDKCVAFYIEK